MYYSRASALYQSILKQSYVQDRKGTWKQGTCPFLAKPQAYNLS